MIHQDELAEYDTFCRSVLKVIEENHLKKRDLADKLGMPMEAFSCCIHNRNYRFNLIQAYRIAHEIGEYMEDLIEGKV